MPKKSKNYISASGLWTAAAVLLICVLLTSSVATASIGLFTYAREPDTVISLLPPEEKMAAVQTAAVTALSARSTAVQPVRGSQPAVVTLSSPRFRAMDTKQVWGKDTSIDIFRASYQNGAGVITAAGRNGNKIVAPGTSNTYLFYLTNDGNAAINYKMHITATVSDNLKNYTVPVRVRLSDETGAWLCGTADTWENFLGLDGTHKDAVLGANCYSAYYLQWEWPFESGDDGFDTLLGNLAADEDLVLTINIDLVAEYNPDPYAPGGNPKTGDNAHLELWFSVMVLSFVGLVILLPLGLRRKASDEV